jgi:hypothetical protein
MNKKIYQMSFFYRNRKKGKMWRNEDQKMSHLLRKKDAFGNIINGSISIMRNERKQHANYIPIDVC